MERRWEEQDSSEAARALTEAAWARPLDEVLDLVVWMEGMGDWGKIDGFVTDVVRLRPAEDVVCFTRELAPSADNWFSLGTVLAEAVEARVSARNAAFYGQKLVVDGGLGNRLRGQILAAVLSWVANPDEAVDLLRRVSTSVESSDCVGAGLKQIASQRIIDGFPLVVVLGLYAAGLSSLAHRTIDELSLYLSPGRTSDLDFLEFRQGLRALDERSLRTFFSIVAARSPDHATTLFAWAVLMAAKGRNELDLIDQLLDELGPAFEQHLQDGVTMVPGDLTEYMAHRHAGSR